MAMTTIVLPANDVHFGISNASLTCQAAPRRNNSPPYKSYTNAEWEAIRATITQWYSVERQPLAQVLRRLRQVGFLVNERMLHTRIRRWKLGRNHKFPEMGTAAHLLAEYLDRHLVIQRTVSPGFRIRGELVDHSEFLRYFRRKKISDPVKWVKEQNDEFVLSEDVELITGTTTPESNSADDPDDEYVVQVDAENNDRADQEQPSCVPEVADHPAQQHQEPSSLVETRRRSPDTHDLYTPTLTAKPPIFLRPQTFHALEHLTYTMSTYVSFYATSARFLTHTEPAVHAHTVHAMFASRMQDGISSLLFTASSAQKQKASTSKAFTDFQKGFDMILQILSNDHPMSLSLMLTVICELARHNHTAFKALTFQLLKYTTEMSGLALGRTHALTILFSILLQQLVNSDLSTLANMILTSLRLATAHLSTHNPYDWKTLYLRERLCDSLYHSGSSFQSERSQMRARLLTDQERVYGLPARNVLWTLTNVADDALEEGRVDKAIGYFRQALERADTSEGYGRAKTRFAALEGLGRCEVKMAEKAEKAAEVRPQVAADHTVTRDMQHVSNILHSTSQTTTSCCNCACHSSTSKSTSKGSSTQGTGQSTPTSSSSSKSQLNQREQHLRQALTYFRDAEKEASLWFEESSRRTARVRQKIEQVKHLLGSVEIMANRDSEV
ncbi:hypothetical protein LTR10_013545 [Elasticomyces elasticus]|uniref:Clr5 domain-containing protein n=1 Tax=Exophiala sideris TaxID=1016849 RepID=A0ABR0JQ17_9EURO|nr:hypothetical protein LTR10_013545 [Elasticomyces elasticus]KAK5039683.1 hypothetical protein LTS07_000178 [Exophiala sideris]KAK5041235.1 hypothetical protein LTR13_002710 [Exophiala sideris]KAK5068060.1 hypothetical protein LTR69_000178 [Exophiala sideris]KAK5187362.1 hypothetical protein LTR44_000178 [Eurotiomycetes sp. CCFEE 6388]